jgi:hypothetical protein
VGSAADAAERARLAGGGKFATPEEKKAAERDRQSSLRMFGRLGVAAGIATSVANTAGVAATAYGDPYGSGPARSRAIVGSIPVASQWLRIAEAVNERENKLGAVRVTGAQLGQDVTGRGQLAAATLGYDLPQAGREEAARQANMAAPRYGSRFNRESATGEQAFREQQRLLPVRREIAKTERELAAATAEVNKAQSIELKAERNLTELRKRASAANREAGKSREDDYKGDLPKEEREAAILAVRQAADRANTELIQAEEHRRAAGEAVAGAKNRVGGVRGRLAELRGQDEENRAGIFEERAATASGSARNLGGQNVYDRAFGLQAFKALQQYGPDALPPEMLAAAQQFAPQTAGKILERHGAGTAEFAEGQKVAPADFTGNPEELRQKADEARRAAEDARREAERTILQVAADAGKELGTIVSDVIKRVTEEMKKGIENAEYLKRANQ